MTDTLSPSRAPGSDIAAAGVGYLWVPHLPIAVALRGRPEIDGGRVVVGDDRAGGGVVLDASDDCLAAGVRIGRPLCEALKFCPDAEFLPTAPDADRRAHGALLDLVATVAPDVEADGAGRAYFAPDRALDREDGRWLLATLRAMVRERLGLKPRLALAPGKFPARVAAERDPEAARGAPIVLPGEAAMYLAPLPVDVLPLSPRALERLRLLGVVTVGQFARLPPGGLARRFGREAVEAHRLALGEDGKPVAARRPPDVRNARYPFEPPVGAREPLLAAAERLLEGLCGELRAEGKAFRGLTVRIEGESGEVVERTAELRAPATAAEHCRATLRSLIGEAAVGEAAAAISVALSAVGAAVAEQPELLAEAWGRSERRKRLEEAAREVGRRYPARLRRVVPNEIPTLLDEHRFGLLPYEPGDGHPAPLEIPPAALRSAHVERAGGRPCLIEGGRRDELMSVHGCWRAEEWWPSEVERVYWRVRTRRGRVVTLSRDAGGWRLVEVLD